METAPKFKLTGQPVPRCCQTPTRRFTREQLGMWQTERFGSPEWQRLWDRRNLVEGSYGIMKNRSMLDWGRDFHHYVGLARESIIATFAAVAYNFHMLRSWKARQQLVEPDPDDSYDPFAPERLHGSLPPLETELAEVEVRAPKGLDFLATSRAGPD